MKTAKLVVVVLLILAGRNPDNSARADSVTLNSGEIVHGSILSESDTQVVIEAALSNRTIFVSRTYDRSEVKSLHHDTAEDQQATKEFDDLRRFHLNANQECTTNRCMEVIGAFQRFLSLYPSSEFVPDVRQKVAAWDDEYRHVADGFVKNENAWMRPVEKQAQMALRYRDLKQHELDALQTSQQQLKQNVASDESSLRLAQAQVNSMPDSFTNPGLNGGSQTVVNTEKIKAQHDLAFYQAQVQKGQPALAAMDAKIAEAQQKLAAADQAYQTAEAAAEAAATNTAETDGRNVPDEISLANAFDALLFACEDGNVELAVDPEVVDLLVDIRVELAPDGQPPRMAALRPLLEQNGFSFHQTTLGNGHNTELLTTPASWTYYVAIQQIENNDIVAAYQTLSGARYDRSGFAQQCGELQSCLEEIIKSTTELPTLERNVRENITIYEQTRRSAILSQAAGESALSAGAARSDRAMTEANLATATSALQTSCGSLFALAQMGAGTRLRDRIEEALRNQLTTEADFLLDYVSADFERLRKLNTLLQSQGGLPQECTFDLAAASQAIYNTQSALDQYAKEANDIAIAATQFLPGDLESPGSRFSEALSIDRASPTAKVGAGFCDFRRCTIALHDLFNQETSATEHEERLKNLFGEARRNHWSGIIRASNLFTRESIDNMDDADDLLSSGNGNGLAITRNHGKISPVYVQLVPRESIKVTQTVAVAHGKSITDGRVRVDYWSDYASRWEVEFKERLVSFCDYGAKDLWMETSAEQMGQWLVSVVPFDTNSKKLKVCFQDLNKNWEGDSMGAAFAVSGYASLTQGQAWANVAMTGSIRASGKVAAVGGLPQKIDGAAHSERIEVVIVPQENEPALSAVPADELCRLVIVTGNNMRTYLKYALAPKVGAMENDQFEARHVIAATQYAQMLLMAGRYDAARQLLTLISKTHPEIYTARRLLAFLRHKVPTEGSALNTGDRAEIRRFESELTKPNPTNQIPQSVTVAATASAQGAPVTAPPPAQPQPESTPAWYVRAWKWFHG